MISQTTRKNTATGPYDYTWARRIRHAFRLLVVLVLVFTFALWFSEGYLRYDRSETQYRMALTLHPAQARPILRTVVRREMEDNEQPPARYVEALAQVEEPENILETYDIAYRINPRNASLIINYGCALYEDGQYEEARERFREAGVNPPANVLPRYLEAAALAAGLGPETDLTELIALITRANASDAPVLFPEPLWHESMPQQGQRYLERRREIARQIIRPLVECEKMIVARAREDIQRGDTRDWDNWLENLAMMGARLMGDNDADSQPSAPQLIAALEIQRDAAQVRADISQMDGGVVASPLHNALLRIEEALKALETFEEGYNQLLTLQYFRLFLPITLLVETAFAFLFVYSLGWLLQHLGVSGKSARAVPHVWIGKAAPALGMIALLIMLTALMIAHNTTQRAEWESHIPLIWRAVVAALLTLGMLYPLLLAIMSNMFERLRVNNTEADASLRKGRRLYSLRHYTGVYGCLLRRYMGILNGGLIIVVCLWLLIYRIAYDIYPFQMELISSDIAMETELLIEEIRQYLAVL